MICFISGGVKNGKTRLALDISCKVANNNPKYYLATMIPFDSEDDLRIKNHRKERENLGFITIEKSSDVGNISLENNPTILLDSLTALLLNEFFIAEKENTSYDLVPIKIINDLDSLIKRSKNIIFVSDYIYSDGVTYNSYTESFKKCLAVIDKYVASRSDVVIERVMGINHFIKGNIDL